MNTDITILPADKGNAIVVLNTVHCSQKIGVLLQDPYDRRLAKDPTETVECKTSLLLHLQSFTSDYVPRAQESRGIVDCLRCI
jgi:hypothetical protein